MMPTSLSLNQKGNRMPNLIVVPNPDNWHIDLEDVEVITPSRYISDEAFLQTKGLKVINL
jgi:hypothetical protein